MSQNDMVIADQSHTNFRADLNLALQALISQSSGATEPATKYAYQLWADTTTGLLKIRNAANDAWITVGTLASAYLGLEQVVQKGAENGYPSLDATTKVPIAQMATGTPDGTKFIRDDRTLVNPTITILNGYINGLTLSNNAGDANNDIDIAVGMATDSTNAYLMTLSSSLTKRLDAAWAVGTNQGGLDTGSEAISTWYHIWLIRKDSDGTIDALFSTSATAPSMPAGWTYKRRIGAVRNDASGNIIAFSQLDDEFLWSVAVLDVNVTIGVTTAVLYALSVPLGVKTWALMRSVYYIAGSGAMVVITSPGESDQAPSVTAAPLCEYFTMVGAVYCANLKVRTDTSSQIRTRSSGGGEILRIATYGYIDLRGKY